MKKNLAALVVMVALIGTVVFGVCQPAAAQTPKATTTWRLQSTYYEGSLMMQAVKKAFDSVYKDSGGRLKIDVYTGGSIVPVMEMFNAVSQGVLPIIEGGGGYWEGSIPVTVLEGGLPFQFMGSLKDLKGVLDSGLETLFREAYASKNVYLLGYQSDGPYPSIMSRVPIRKFEDWRGLKVRGFSAFNTLYSKMGCGAVYITPGETYTALKMGTVNVATLDVGAVVNSKFYEVFKYLITPQFIDHIVSHVLVNMDAWNKLPADLKQVLKNAERKLAQDEYDIQIAEWKRVYDKSKELGYEVLKMPDGDMEKIKKLAITIWDEYAAKDPLIAKGIKITKDYYKIK